MSPSGSCVSVYCLIVSFKSKFSDLLAILDLRLITASSPFNLKKSKKGIKQMISSPLIPTNKANGDIVYDFKFYRLILPTPKFLLYHLRKLDLLSYHQQVYQ